jgi:hypothetical protein
MTSEKVSETDTGKGTTKPFVDVEEIAGTNSGWPGINATSSTDFTIVKSVELVAFYF